MGSSGAALKNNEIDSSRLNFNLDSCEIGMQKVTVAVETENLLQVISNKSFLERTKKDSSTRLLADLENDLNIDPAPANPDPATYGVAIESNRKASFCIRHKNLKLFDFKRRREKQRQTPTWNTDPAWSCK